MAEKSTRTAAEQKELDEGLWYAAWNGKDQEVESFIAQGANVNYIKIVASSLTPLLAAAAGSGSVSTVKILLNSGADTTKTDLDEMNCMHWVCYSGYLDLITFLMDKGLSLESPCDKYGKTPLDYLKEEEKGESSFIKERNQRRQECLKALKIGVKNSNETEVVDQDTAATANASEGLQSNVKSPAPNIHDVERSINQASGKIKVARVLLHGGPQVGKTSVKRLIFNYPPLPKEEEQSTPLLEDPVRAISTRRMMSTDHKNLEEVDEAKLIQMIQKEVKSHLSKREEEKLSPSPSNSTSRGSKSLDVGIAPAKKKPQTSSNEASDVPSKIMPEVLTDIAKDLDSIDPDTPELFACQFAHLIDSGGQPQFSDLLPLVFQSESHHHMVVVPLNEKLDTKPRNCVNVRGERMELPDSLLLTHFQLIERVCQSAKASESRVMVVGTHLDQEDVNEPLAEKNRILSHLLAKYQDNLVPNKDGNVIFPVNAMSPKGKKREEYSRVLQSLILDVCCPDDGKTIPLRWMALELELSRRSKESGEIVEKAQCREVAEALGIHDLDNALSFFTDIAVHYHYPKAVPGIIFTSVGAISSRLSTVVEESFLCRAQTKDSRKLKISGKLTREYLFRLLSKAPESKLLTNDNFLKLIRHLRIVFNIDDDTLFIPSLLQVDPTQKSLDDFHPEPLAFYWYDDDYQEVRILPQSFYHALIVELLRKKESIRLNKRGQSRSSILLNLTLESGKECMVCLMNGVFWLEACVEKRVFSPGDIPLLTQIIQSCSRAVIEQLNLANTLGNLQCGLLCPKKKCGIELPHLCASCGPDCSFKCLENQTCRWNEQDDARMLWISCLQLKAPKTGPSKKEAIHPEHNVDHHSNVTAGIKQKTEGRDISTADDEGISLEPCDPELKPLSQRTALTHHHLADEQEFMMPRGTSDAAALNVHLQRRPKLYDAHRLTKCCSSKWNEIGRELGVPFDYRQELFGKYRADKDRLEDVLQRWIQSESVPVTWSSLISALEAIDHKDVAREVKDFLRTFKDEDSRPKETRQGTERSGRCTLL